MPEFRITSRPGEADDLVLDHETMPYAGKFGRRRPGTAVLCLEGTVVAALAFSPNRRDPGRCMIRYLSVARDHQREGLAGELVASFVDWATGAGYRSARITVLNPFAVGALADAGFGYAGASGPGGGVVMAYPAGADPAIDAALARLAEGDLDGPQRRYVQRHLDGADTAGGRR